MTPADYDALRHGVGAYRWSRDLVTVSGPDAATYLQGQCSQDLSSLAVGDGVPSLVLEPDGKLTALVRVTRVGPERFALDTDGGYGETVAARLARYRLRTKVEIEPAEWPCVALRGAGVSVAPTGGPPWVLAVEWNGTVGVDLLGPGAEEVVPPGARWCGAPAWEALRVEAGIPAMGAELDGRTIAAEAGLVERTVSFTKGCYTGQELVARLDARGSRVARRLCGVVPGHGPADPAAFAGAELSGGDRPVGSVTSAAWSPALGGVAGLGYVHRSVELGAEVRWASGGDEGTARVVGLPIAG